MEILEEPRTTVNLRDVQPGRTFVFNNVVYMKVHSGGTLNAVTLASGGLHSIQDSLQVYPVDFVASRK